MLRTVCIALLWILCANLQAQSTTEALRKAIIEKNSHSSDSWTAYKGTIGEKKQVYVLLNIKYKKLKEGQEVIGEYFYTKYGIPITLKGTVKQKRLVLKEYVNGKHTGTMDLTIEWSDLEGQWKSPKGKSYKIRLSEADLNVYVQRFYYKRHHKITNSAFKTLVELFSPVYTPSTLESEIVVNKLSDDLVVQYFEPEFKEKKAEFEVMFYEYSTLAVLFREDFIILTTTEGHSPGAGGVHGTDYRIHTFTYDGTPIDMINLGCDCIDADLGVSEEHVTLLTIILD